MRNVLILMLVMVYLAIGQIPVRTTPQSHDWIKLYDGSYLLVGDGGDQQDTSLAFCPKQWNGVATLALKGDTTNASIKSANQSSSYLRIIIQFKNNNLAWGYYANDVAVTTVLDTLDRALVNTGGTITRYFNLASYDQWVWADSARFIFVIGTTDSLKLYPEVGGQ